MCRFKLTGLTSVPVFRIQLIEPTTTIIYRHKLRCWRSRQHLRHISRHFDRFNEMINIDSRNCQNRHQGFQQLQHESTWLEATFRLSTCRHFMRLGFTWIALYCTGSEARRLTVCSPEWRASFTSHPPLKRQRRRLARKLLGMQAECTIAIHGHLDAWIPTKTAWKGRWLRYSPAITRACR